MVQTGNKTKCVSLVSRTAKTIHHHHYHHHHHHQRLCSNTVSSSMLLLLLFYRFLFSYFPSKSAVIKEKKQAVYGFCSNKVSSKLFVIYIFYFDTPSTQSDPAAQAWYFEISDPRTWAFQAVLITLQHNWCCGVNPFLYFTLTNITNFLKYY